MSEGEQKPTNFGQRGLGSPITGTTDRWEEQALERLSAWEQWTPERQSAGDHPIAEASER
jgi:hypothetical protein